jgi:membrane protein YqaA with SNARE-associated domain
MVVTRLAFLWGYAEATLFFVIPDAVITRAALDSRRAARLATVAAIAGSLLGGAVSWLSGAYDLAGAREMLDWLPAISVGMMDRAHQHLIEHGMLGALLGSFVGVPYKLYAVHAASAGIGLAWFLLLSVPVRAARFVFLGWLTATLRERAVPHWPRRRLIAVWFVIWAINYGLYWWFTPN